MNNLSYLLKIMLLGTMIASIQFSGKGQDILHVTVIDKETGKPIEWVSIVYPQLQEGTHTNRDGIAELTKKSGEYIQIFHLSYEPILISAQEIALKHHLTIALQHKSISIEEVNITYFDLRKALLYVIKNFKKLYHHKPTDRIANLKETMHLDGELKRLVLSKFGWSSKNYIFNKHAAPKFKLFDVEYNKSLALNIFQDIPEYNQKNTEYINFEDIIRTLYLEQFLHNLYVHTPTIQVDQITSDQDILIVKYVSDWSKIQNQTTKSSGTIVFDKKTKAIIELSNEIDHQGNQRYLQILNSPLGYMKQTTRSYSMHQFYKNEDGKYSLQLFKASSDGVIAYKTQSHRLSFDNTIYFLKETKINPNDKGPFVDTKIPLYQNIPQTALRMPQLSSINLNTEELMFMNNEK